MFRAYLSPSSGDTTVCVQQLVLTVFKLSWLDWNNPARVIVTDCREFQVLCQLINFGNHLSVGPKTVDTHFLDFIGLNRI